MVDIEDLKIYFYDSFLSEDQFNILDGGSGYVEIKPTYLKMSCGVTKSSYAHINYDGKFFNPLYAEAVFKLQLNTKTDMIAFWGFKDSLDAPTANMTESHAGFLIADNKIYLSTADGDNQQKVEINTIDVTKMFEYKIRYNEFSYKPLPEIEMQLSLPTIISVDRVWKLLQTNSNYPPENQSHYLVAYIGNNATTGKYLYINRIIYKEQYAD